MPRPAPILVACALCTIVPWSLLACRSSGTGAEPVETDAPVELETTPEVPAPPAATPPVDPGSPADEALRTKLDGTLWALVETLRSDGEDDANAKAAAENLGPEGWVEVALVLSEGADAGDVEAEIEALGGEITTVFEDNLYGRLPIAAIERIGGLEAIWTLRVQQRVAAPFDGADEDDGGRG